MPAKLFELQLGLLLFLVACRRVVTPGTLGTRQRDDVAHFSLLRTQIAYSSTAKRKLPLRGSRKAKSSIRNSRWKNSRRKMEDSLRRRMEHVPESCSTARHLDFLIPPTPCHRQPLRPKGGALPPKNLDRFNLTLVAVTLSWEQMGSEGVKFFSFRNKRGFADPTQTEVTSTN